MCLCFFGFLRSGEMVAPDDSNFDPAQHLSFRDITVDSLTCPSCLSVNIKQLKTDPFRVGVLVIVGWTGEDLCPVTAVLAYMTIRGSGGGPLFYFKDGCPLTRQRLVSKLRGILQRIGIDHQKYSGHSFHIGAATTAARRGYRTHWSKPWAAGKVRHISCMCGPLGNSWWQWLQHWQKGTSGILCGTRHL